MPADIFTLKIGDIFSIVVLSGSLSAGIAFLFKALIEEKIKHEFGKDLERFKTALSLEIKVREQAAKIAELLANLQPGAPKDLVKINQIAYELTLWLPPELVRKMADVMTKEPGSPDFERFLIDIRTHILQGKAADITAKDIIHFNPKPTITQPKPSNKP